MLFYGLSASGCPIRSSDRLSTCIHPLQNEAFRKIQSPLHVSTSPCSVSLQVWLPLPTLPLTTCPTRRPCSSLARFSLPPLPTVSSPYSSASSNGNIVSLTPFSLPPSFPHLTLGCCPHHYPFPSPTSASLPLPETVNPTPKHLPYPVFPQGSIMSSLCLFTPRGTVGPVWEGGSLGT